MPRRRIEYRGVVLEEMDLDALLARRPTVALVDELAHTNAPGSRNAKRYQDVEELLRAGINVITTLNIQHLESLYDIVEQATGVKVKERVPDYVLGMADQLVNVDLSAEDLRERLQAGKVYPPERIADGPGELLHAGQPDSPARIGPGGDRPPARPPAAANARETERPAWPSGSWSASAQRAPTRPPCLRKGARFAGPAECPLVRRLHPDARRGSRERIDAATQRQIANTRRWPTSSAACR